MKYEFMEHYRSCFRVERMCHALSVSKSGYYAWRRRKISYREEQNLMLLEKIQAIHEQSRRLYGSPRMTQELKAQNVCCSENRIARLMRENGIKAKIKRKFRRRTKGKGALVTYADNVLNRRFSQTSPNRVWVTDLTHIWTRGGTQFASFDYQGFLKLHGYIPSMNRQGNCWDNAVMESFFHALKMEHVYWESFQTREEAALSVFNYIELFYNSWRRHSSLNFKSPLEYERMNSVA